MLCSVFASSRSASEDALWIIIQIDLLHIPHQAHTTRVGAAKESYPLPSRGGSSRMRKRFVLLHLPGKPEPVIVLHGLHESFCLRNRLSMIQQGQSSPLRRRFSQIVLQRRDCEVLSEVCSIKENHSHHRPSSTLMKISETDYYPRSCDG